MTYFFFFYQDQNYYITYYETLYDFQLLPKLVSDFKLGDGGDELFRTVLKRIKCKYDYQLLPSNYSTRRQSRESIVPSSTSEGTLTTQHLVGV
jgi:hypothetical protein